MAPSRELLYFNFNGYTESIRYLLHYGGLEFEDNQIDIHKWPVMEIKESLPFGQMPLYTEDGRTLNQSFAIARYIASQIPGLLPSDPWEQAQLDATVLNIYDCVKRLFPYLSEQEPEKKEPLKQHLYQGIHYAFSRFEKELKASNGHFGGKLSWADFMLVGAIGTLNFFLEETFQKDYPTLAALMDEIESSPGVKEYLATKKPYVRDFLHVYKYYKP